MAKRTSPKSEAPGLHQLATGPRCSSLEIEPTAAPSHATPRRPRPSARCQAKRDDSPPIRHGRAQKSHHGSAETARTDRARGGHTRAANGPNSGRWRDKGKRASAQSWSDDGLILRAELREVSLEAIHRKSPRLEPQCLRKPASVRNYVRPGCSKPCVLPNALFYALAKEYTTASPGRAAPHRLRHASPSRGRRPRDPKTARQKPSPDFPSPERATHQPHASTYTP